MIPSMCLNSPGNVRWNCIPTNTTRPWTCLKPPGRGRNMNNSWPSKKSSLVALISCYEFTGGFSKTPLKGPVIAVYFVYCIRGDLYALSVSFQFFCFDQTQYGTAFANQKQYKPASRLYLNLQVLLLLYSCFTVALLLTLTYYGRTRGIP